MKIEMKKLGDIATYINGYAFKPEQWALNGMPIIRIQNLNNDNAEFNYFNGEIDEKYIVKKEDVLISWSASIGVYEWKKENAVLNQHIFKVVFDKCEIDKKYFKYMVSIALNRALQFMHGSTMKHITKKYFDNIMIPIPNIITQRKIGDILDKAQELIDKRKSQIEALDELVKSRFIEMFGDPITNSKGLPITTLGEICNMKAGKTIKAKDIYDTFDSKMYPCYGGNGLRGYALTYTHEGNFPLIGRQGALCGNVKYAEGKFYATEHAIVTQPKVPLNTYWLFIMLREMNLNRLASGAAQPGLNVSTLVPLDVIYPSVELQNQFASFAQQVDKLKFEMQESLKELEDNFNSLMQRAFKGELFN